MATKSNNPVQGVGHSADVQSADGVDKATAKTTVDTIHDATKDIHLYVAPEAGATAPIKKQSAAVRMMTKSIAIAKPTSAKGKARQIVDAGKPSQKPGAGGATRPRRRGASKGR